MVYDSFILELLYFQFCEDKMEYGEGNSTAIEKLISQENPFFRKNNIFLFITRNKKYSSKEVASKHAHWWKKFLCSYYFWRFVNRFDTYGVKKLEVYLYLYESSLLLQRRDDQISSCYEKYIWLPTCRYLIWLKNSSLTLIRLGLLVLVFSWGRGRVTLISSLSPPASADVIWVLLD